MKQITYIQCTYCKNDNTSSPCHEFFNTEKGKDFIKYNKDFSDVQEEITTHIAYGCTACKSIVRAELT